MRTYSYSQLETFDTCPLKYKFGYIDKIEKVEQSIEAFVGSRVHDTLEKLYKDLRLQKLNSLDELLAFFQDNWERNWGPAVKIREPGLAPKNYFDYGARCIHNYYERYKPFNQSQTLKTELSLKFSLDSTGRYRMLGILDRVARRADGTYEVHDYKTGGDFPSKERLDSDRQLGLYEIGLRSYWPDIERVELIWHYVGLDSTFRSKRLPQQLEELREQTIGAIDRIEREKEFKPRKGDWCDWCEYRPECPLWKHVVAIETLPPAKFAADAGVRLATAYARTKFEIDRLEEQREALREEILVFVRQTQARVLQGHGVRVNVHLRERMSLPSKGQPERRELEDLLRRVGKWDEVSDLSARQLERVLKEAKWKPQLLEQLRKFVTIAESATLQVSRTDSSIQAEH